MALKHSPVSVTRIEQTIFLIRGQRVMLDSDLAELYGVPTKRLNEQVTRNRDRFPDDFMFGLSKSEKDEVVANCDHLAKLKFSPALPRAFTEQGVAMLSSVLRSKRAVRVNIEIMRLFVRLRQLLLTHADLARKLNALENKYDAQFKVVFDAIRHLMNPPVPKKRKIGFAHDE
jgi:hypothetical protein